MRSPLDLSLWRRGDRAPGTAVALAQAPAYVSTRATTALGLGFSRDNRETQQRAYGVHGTLFQIVNRTAFTTSTAEWELWRKATSGRKEDREQQTDHAVLDLWNIEPNKFYTGQEFREALGQHFELTGEAWIVVVRRKGINLPVELWPVRPDRMHPVPSATDYLAGYVYCAPDGEKVPLGLNEVIYMRQPSPLDPYRGMSAIGTVLLDIDGARLAREWNRNFFHNSAEPGGVIELETALAEHEFDEMRERWAEQHRGVSNAHRVAILERGKWIQRSYSMKDMQFTQLLDSNREAIREAFGFPKPLLGAVDDVNRANADAAAVVFAKWVIESRLIRWRGVLNARLLPMFGATTKGLEFDFCNSVPEDQELANATRDSKINAAVQLVTQLHASRESVIEALELPATLVFEAMPEPAPPALPPGAGQPTNLLTAIEPELVELPVGAYVRAERALPVRPYRNDAAEAAAVDLDQMQRDWERELDQLLSRWTEVTTRQRAYLRDQVVAAVEAQDPRALAQVSAQAPDDDGGAELLALALAAMFALGAAAVAREAAVQGVEVEPAEPGAAPAPTEQRPPDAPERRRDDDNPLPELAAGMAAVLASALAVSASREALRQYQPGMDSGRLADAVDAHLAALSDAYLRDNLGGLLTRAQNLGRLATLDAAPTAAYYASEVLDKNTCKPCRLIDGQRLPTLDAAMLAYGGSGYLFCEGTWRCRGTMVAVWGEDDDE